MRLLTRALEGAKTQDVGNEESYESIHARRSRARLFVVNLARHCATEPYADAGRHADNLTRAITGDHRKGSETLRRCGA